MVRSGRSSWIRVGTCFTNQIEKGTVQMQYEVGYAAMCEQFMPNDLIRFCQRAEAAGFKGHMVSDHFNPWTPQQGQSAFVWPLLGALGAQTRGDFGTGVTAPGYRVHPIVVAHAAATTSQMFPGRF